jgi:hypothetical protein
MKHKKEPLYQPYKSHISRLADAIGQDPKRFADLMAQFFSNETHLNQPAAGVMSACLDRYPFLLLPHQEALVLHLNPDLPGYIKRNTLRALQYRDIPPALQGSLADTCFRFLAAREPPAIKVYALTVIANLARTEPDLNNELKLVIEDQWPYASPAFKSRAGKILQALRPV